jgi:hypothetical protein
MKGYNQIQPWASKMAGIAVLLADLLLAGSLCFGAPTNSSQIPNIFKPQSTYAYSIYRLSVLVLAVCAIVFVVVFGLLVYCVVKYRRRQPDDGREPPQVELAWTVIPLLIVGFISESARLLVDAAEPYPIVRAVKPHSLELFAGRIAFRRGSCNRHCRHVCKTESDAGVSSVGRDQQ